MPRLGTRASYWSAGAVVAIALWTSACPTMTYPLYQADWHVSTTTVTWIFAAYPIALIPVLVIFGNLSDHIGRRASMLLGLAAELLGVLFFAGAEGVPMLMAGRAFMGLGVGLSIGSASVAMVEFSAPGRAHRTGAVSTAISALGIALAMIVGGALTQYAPFPLHLNFLVLAAVIAVVALFVSGMPRHAPQQVGQSTQASQTSPAAQRPQASEPSERWRVRPLRIPRGTRQVFVAGALAFASSFLLGAIVLPLGAKIADQLAGSTNALVTGALLSVFATCVSIFALAARRMAVWVVVVTGAAGSMAAVWLFVLTGAVHSLTLFFLASAVAGAAYAFNFAGGLTVFNRYSARHHHASMVSGGYLVGYFAQGVAAPALGAVVTAHGLMSGLLTGATAFSVFFALVIASGLAVLVPLHRSTRRGLAAGAARAGEAAVDSARTGEDATAPRPRV